VRLPRCTEPDDEDGHFSVCHAVTEKIGKNEAVTIDDLAGLCQYRITEAGAIEHEGVKFTIFATRVDGFGQVAKESHIEAPPGKQAIELTGVEAGDDRAYTASHHVQRELARRQVPEREQRLDSRTLQLPLTVRANVTQEEIAESNRLNADVEGAGAQGSHAGLIDIVRARPRQFDGPERQSDAGRLRFDQWAANRMHRDTIEGGIESRDQADDIEIGLSPKLMQRPAAIFAAAPRQQDFFSGHGRRYQGAEASERSAVEMLRTSLYS